MQLIYTGMPTLEEAEGSDGEEEGVGGQSGLTLSGIGSPSRGVDPLCLVSHVNVSGFNGSLLFLDLPKRVNSSPNCCERSLEHRVPSL